MTKFDKALRHLINEAIDELGIDGAIDMLNERVEYLQNLKADGDDPFEGDDNGPVESAVFRVYFTKSLKMDRAPCLTADEEYVEYPMPSVCPVSFISGSNIAEYMVPASLANDGDEFREVFLQSYGDDVINVVRMASHTHQA